MTTEPMPLGDNDLATVDLDVRNLGSAEPGAAVRCRGELTKDGVTWTDAPELETVATAPGSVRQTGRVSGVALRVVVTSEVAGAPQDVPGVSFDLRVALART